jgi:hypothetical protein
MQSNVVNFGIHSFYGPCKDVPQAATYCQNFANHPSSLASATYTPSLWKRNDLLSSLNVRIRALNIAHDQLFLRVRLRREGFAARVDKLRNTFLL